MGQHGYADGGFAPTPSVIGAALENVNVQPAAALSLGDVCHVAVMRQGNLLRRQPRCRAWLQRVGRNHSRGNGRAGGRWSWRAPPSSSGASGPRRARTCFLRTSATRSPTYRRGTLLELTACCAYLAPWRPTPTSKTSPPRCRNAHVRSLGLSESMGGRPCALDELCDRIWFVGASSYSGFPLHCGCICDGNTQGVPQLASTLEALHTALLLP